MAIQRLLQLLDQQTKLLFENSSWVLGGNIFRALLVFLRGVIVARGLGVELYGTFAIILAFVSSIQQFFAFTASTTIIKYGAAYLTEGSMNKLTALIKSGFVLALLTSFVSTIIIAGLSLLLYDVFLTKPGLEWSIVVYAIVSSTLFIDNISNTLLRLFYKFKEKAIIDIVNTVIDLSLIAAVLFFRPNNFGYFFITFITVRLISSIILNGATFVILKDKFAPYLDAPMSSLNDQWKGLINFTVTNSGSRALRSLMDKGDVLLLGALLGPVPVAFYNIAKKLAYAILILIDPMTNAIFPQLSILISEKKTAEAAVMIKRITKIVFFPSIAFILVAYFIKEPLILYTYGAEYEEAAKPFVFLVINAILGAIFFWNLPLILSLGLVRFRFVVNAILLVVGGVVAYLFIPLYGAAGAAIGLLVANGLIICIFSIVGYSKISKDNSEAK